MKTAGVIILALTSAFSTSWLAAQTSAPAFEVASVKPDRTGNLNRGISLPADRLEATNVSVQQMIAAAYGDTQSLLDEQVVGAQGWVNDETFDVVGKAGSDLPAGAAGRAQKLLMLRALLAERFKLTIHHEERTGTVYALVMARPDGRLGPQLRRSDVDCQAEAATAGATPPPPPPDGRPRCSAMVGLGPVSLLRAGGQTMALFVKLLARLTNRIVIDRTGLSGAFDIDLRFDPEGLPTLGPPGLTRPPPPPNGDTPAFFTAIQEQLGLRLDVQRGPMDVVVVDHVEHPTED